MCGHYINELRLETNFGRAMKVGEQEERVVRAFDLNLPKGARVISLAGVYDKKLLSMHAYYE